MAESPIKVVVEANGRARGYACRAAPVIRVPVVGKDHLGGRASVHGDSPLVAAVIAEHDSVQTCSIPIEFATVIVYMLPGWQGIDVMCQPPEPGVFGENDRSGADEALTIGRSRTDHASALRGQRLDVDGD
jgi:hypothetical protein